MANMHRMSQNLLAKPSFNVAITAAGTNGSSADALGWRRAMAVFDSFPTGTGTTSDCKLQDSADNSTFADVASAAFVQVTTALGHKIALLDIDLAKRNRYLRLVHTGAGGSAAGQAVGLFIFGTGEDLAPTQDVAAVSV